MIAEGPGRRSFAGLENLGFNIDILAVRISRCLKHRLKNFSKLAGNTQQFVDILKLYCQFAFVEHTDFGYI